MFFEMLFVHWQLKSNWNLNKKLLNDTNNKLTNTGGGACLGTVGIRIVMSGVDEWRPTQSRGGSKLLAFFAALRVGLAILCTHSN